MIQHSSAANRYFKKLRLVGFLTDGGRASGMGVQLGIHTAPSNVAAWAEPMDRTNSPPGYHGFQYICNVRKISRISFLRDETVVLIEIPKCIGRTYR